MRKAGQGVKGEERPHRCTVTPNTTWSGVISCGLCRQNLYIPANKQSSVQEGVESHDLSVHHQVVNSNRNHYCFKLTQGYSIQCVVSDVIVSLAVHCLPSPSSSHWPKDTLSHPCKWMDDRVMGVSNPASLVGCVG